jgi:hypothetical protein
MHSIIICYEHVSQLCHAHVNIHENAICHLVPALIHSAPWVTPLHHHATPTFSQLDYRHFDWYIHTFMPMSCQAFAAVNQRLTCSKPTVLKICTWA